ncbi:type I secretion system permease/ATPase [Brucella intermedia]|uniref:type I secretion system permease/ATPase n=1 Tax=Brucella intermedia TaxID=94625 RepID=UPI00124D72D3|nr:type I secretion system permease/ATPase [Brucella intermedia]KAB2723348.1 type I secretion system permease/ATPase [Brucella intermedia]
MTDVSASDKAQAQQKPSVALWVDPLLIAARHLGVKISEESVMNASSWSKDVERDQAISDIALSAGLVVEFVEISSSDVSSALLPALIEVDAKHVGVVTACDSEKLCVVLSINGKQIERSILITELGNPCTLLLVRPRETIRDGRLGDYLARKPKSWLRGIFLNNKRLFLELGLGSLCGNLLAIGTSLFAMQVWDRVVPARSTNTLWVLVSGVAIALTLEFLIRLARTAIADSFGKEADLKLSGMFFARALDIRNDARPQSPGTLISQLRDLDQVRELLTSSTLGVLIDLPFVIAFLFIIWLLGGPLALIPLAAIPLLILPGLVAQIPLAKLSNEGLQESAMRNAILMESIYRVEDIKVLQAEPRFRNVWQHVNRVAGGISLKQRAIASLLTNSAQVVQQLAYIGVVVGGVYAIFAGDLSFGAVLACSILTSRTIAPLGQITGVLSRVQSALQGKKGLDNLLSLPVDHDPETERYHKPILVGQYRCENVIFGYDPQEKPSLVIPRLKIEPGEKIAVLGRVGAGKSTLLRLLGGLCTPIQGRVSLDQTPMNLIDVADVRRDVGFLFQESGLFYGTVRENLLIGKPTATDAEILAALKMSGADQLVLNQPHGLDLKLREGGHGLSGGQKQTLLLARTILRSPNIVLLDEPTASLDEATETALIERLQGWFENRTVIIATHRLSILAMVDRVIVVEGGRIVRDGPKDEILKMLSRTSAAGNNQLAVAVEKRG